MICDTTKDLLSIGVAAGHLGATVRELEALADRLGIQPSLRINLVVHFNADQVEQLRDALRDANH